MVRSRNQRNSRVTSICSTSCRDVWPGSGEPNACSHLRAALLDESLAKRTEMVTLSVAAKSTKLKLVDHAVAPDSAVSRRVLQKTAVAATVALMALMILALFIAYVRQAGGRVSAP